ncbi:MAG: pyrimidine 5'-nucleotidase [Alphaproteobacteria bacterium]
MAMTRVTPPAPRASPKSGADAPVRGAAAPSAGADRTPVPDSGAAALGDITAWVFDLDNTLYPSHCPLFVQIDRRMREFIGDFLGLDHTEARRLQKHYFHDFGTTLRGLMLNHGLDPEVYLEYVHRVDVSVVPPNPALKSVLGRLEGRKVVFTNGPRSHAETVLDRIGVRGLFDGIFDVADADYIPKPDPECYRRLVDSHDIDPCGAVLFEDMARNLEPAAALGMATVLVIWPAEAQAQAGGEPAPREGVHHVTDDLVAWLEREAAACSAGG